METKDSAEKDATDSEEEPELMLPHEADGAPLEATEMDMARMVQIPPFLSRWMQVSWDWMQNAKYLINRRQLMTASQLQPLAVCILGRQFDPPSDPRPSEGNVAQDEEKALVDEYSREVQDWQGVVSSEVESRVWCTYRTGFDALHNSSLTTDVGWGCMIRSGQMLLCQGFILNSLGRDWRINRKEVDLHHLETLRLFLDQDSPESPYSIHNVVRYGDDQGIGPGKWWGPYSLCRTFDRIMRKSNLHSIRMHIVAAEGGGGVPELCIEEVEKLCLNSSSVASGESVSGEKPLWTPVIILVPLTLGLGRNVNPLYIPSIVRILESPQSLGFIGGKPGASMYFFGYQGEHFLSFDPHIPQPVGSLDRDVESVISTYHSPTFRLVPLKCIDPSLAFGFLCKTQEEFEDLCTRISELDSRYPILTVTQSRKEYATDYATDYASGSYTDSEESGDDWQIVRQTPA